MPKVSIIVPNYNHAKYLNQRMISIFNQTYQDFDVVLLDDCSTDNSHDIIKQYADHPKVSQIVYNQINTSSSFKQWYKGIEYTRGELVWIAESDDWCDNTFLEKLVPYFNDEEVVIAFAHSKLVFNEESGHYKQCSKEPEISNGIEFIRNVMLTRNYILNASMVIFRKSAFRRVINNRWVELKLAGDWMLWIQILKEGKCVEIFSDLNYCRRHAFNVTNKFRRLGYDFIEGIEVLKTGKEICSNIFNRKSVYLTWISMYKTVRCNFGPGIEKKVLVKLLINEPLFFYYYLYDILRKFAHYIANPFYFNRN